MKKLWAGMVSVFALSAALSALPAWAQDELSDTGGVEFADPEKHKKYKEVIRESVSARTTDGYRVLLEVRLNVKKDSLQSERVKAAEIFTNRSRDLSTFCEGNRNLCDAAAAFEKQYSYNKNMAEARHDLQKRQADFLTGLEQAFGQQKEENKKWGTYCENKDFSCYEEPQVKRALERTSSLHAGIEAAKQDIRHVKQQEIAFQEKNKALTQGHKSKRGENYKEFFDLSQKMLWGAEQRSLHATENPPNEGAYFIWRFRSNLISQFEEAWQGVASRYSASAIKSNDPEFMASYQEKSAQIFTDFEDKAGLSLKISLRHGFLVDAKAMVAKRRADPAFMKTLPSVLMQEEEHFQRQGNQPGN